MTSRLSWKELASPREVTRGLAYQLTNTYERSSRSYRRAQRLSSRSQTLKSQQRTANPALPAHFNMSNYIFGRLARPYPWSDCRSLNQIPSLSDDERSTMKVSSRLNTPQRCPLPGYCPEHIAKPRSRVFESRSHAVSSGFRGCRGLHPPSKPLYREFWERNSCYITGDRRNAFLG